MQDAQKEYKDNVKEKLKTGYTRVAWKGLNIMMGRKKKSVQQYGAVQCFANN